MSTELQIAVLGIVGTLAGTVLGWVLNSLSQKGKLKVFVKKWEEVYQKPDKLGSFEKCNSNEAEYYNYNLSLDIYNSSRETRIMRNIQVVFMDRKSSLFRVCLWMMRLRDLVIHWCIMMKYRLLTYQQNL